MSRAGARASTTFEKSVSERSELEGPEGAEAAVAASDGSA